MIDLLIEEVAVTMVVGAPDRNGARRRSTFAVQFVQGIPEAIEFLLEQLVRRTRRLGFSWARTHDRQAPDHILEIRIRL